MKIKSEAGADYFRVEGLPPGAYQVFAGNAVGESEPAVFTVPAPEPVVPPTPVVEE